MKKSSSKFNIFLSVLLLLGVTFSVIKIVNAVTPNPGHPWSETGDGIFAITGPTALRTFTFPDGNASVATLESSPAFTGTITTGVAGGTTGAVNLKGTTSGTVTLTTASIAGTYTLTLPIDDGTVGQFLKTDGSGITSWATLSGGGDALVANPLSQFAATTSLQLLGVISDETGSGASVFATSPALVTPDLGTPSALVGTNISGTAASLTAGNATAAVTATHLAGGLGGQIPYQSAAGTTAMLANGSAGEVLQSNGTTLAPSWVAAGTGDMVLASIQTVTGAKTFGSAGAVSKLKIAGTTSGAVTLDTSAVAGTAVITIPAVTDTLVGKATTDTFTNKTFDTAGTGNSFSINGVAATANTGTGAVVRASSPALVTPDLGTPSALVGTNISGTAASLTAGNATAAVTATHLAGGLGGQIPYQSAAGTTAMLANGSAGEVLQSNGTTLAPSWVAAGTGDMVLASIQTVTGAKTFGSAGAV